MSPTDKPIDFKRQANLRKPKQLLQLRVPTPVFVLSLPKSGTTTMFRFFDCGSGRGAAAHHWFKNASKVEDRLGVCMGKNVEAGLPLLKSCADFSVYTDAGAMWLMEKKAHCFYPSVHGLEHTDWVTSAIRWHRLLDRMSASCNDFPPKGSTLEDGERFYIAHNERARDFASRQPGWHYLEHKLESADVGAELEADVGIQASCWGHCLPNRQCYKQVNSSNASVRIRHRW